MQPQYTKSGSFNAFMESVRSPNVEIDNSAAQTRILGALLVRDSVQIGELVQLSGLPPMEGMRLVNAMESENLLQSTPVANEAPQISLTVIGKDIAAAL